MVFVSTTVSHTATFQTLKEVRIKIADKLSRVPMGYIMDQSSGRFKDVIVDRVESMEPILAHLVPEMTSNLFVPLCIIVYLFILDWRMALASLVTLPIGFLCYMGMSRGYSERFSGLMKRVQKMNATIIEYVGGIEVIKAFNQSANSYQKYSDAVNDDARPCRFCQAFGGSLFFDLLFIERDGQRNADIIIDRKILVGRNRDLFNRAAKAAKEATSSIMPSCGRPAPSCLMMRWVSPRTKPA